jgi:RloB-like protein
MGSDNLHHKRKAKALNKRKAKALNKTDRQKASCESYDRVLIVCEDSKSSPSYLEAIRDDLKLSPNIDIHGEECGSAPVSVVEYAKKLMEKDTGYDKVYCVIDRDQHPNFQKVLKSAKDKKIKVIVSIPCFEYWLLLHFKYITSPFQAAQGSHCGEVIKALKKLKGHWSNYEKSKNFLKEHYSCCLKEKQDTAITNAKTRASMCQDDQLKDKNPYTQMYLLIEYLSNIKPA